ncbi:MAG TPA: HNH endonuclease signature motif containing protein, partial [Microbacteriaceae bacterium]
LLRLGVNVAPEKMYGKIVPVVTIAVTQESLNTGTGTGTGFAVIQGNPAPVSIATAPRLICAGATQELLITPTGGPLDLGRTRRLFNKPQHDALAVRDGGCMWPGCTRPPAGSEAHHINEYERDHGNTDIADGILLCRFHHLLLHNNRWQITRTGDNYTLIRPASVDRKQTPIPLKSKSLLITKLRQRKTG